MSSPQVRLRDIARGLIRAVPDAVAHPNWRLLKYVLLRPDSAASIGLIIEDWARIAPERIALRFDDQRWTYKEFNAWANRLAATFAAHGVKPGDAVAILMENRPEALACVAAAVKLGAVAGMLNHHQRGDALSHSIKLLKPRAMVVGAESREALASTPSSPGEMSGTAFFWSGPNAPPGYLDLARESAGKSAANRPATAQIKASTPCYYIFTSGTTGLPKASVMTHYRWLALLTGAGAALRLRPDDVFYCCLPLYHNNALTVSWGAALSAGATLALDRKFSASKFWDRVRQYDATAFCYIGELLRYLLNAPASSRDREHRVRLIVGNGLRPDIWEAFEQRFGIERIHEFYGASEANVGFVNAFGLRQTAGFTYMPYAIVEFDAQAEQPLRDARGFMKKTSKGAVGLLISEVTERRPFDGYTDAAASEKKLLRNVFKKDDCWFNSGDLVRDQGWRHIQFVDRVGDTFRWKGENVATNEIENALATIAEIEHGAVYGVAVPGADGRAGMAAVTLKDGAAFDGAQLARALQAALPPYAVPLFVRVQARQETTGTFKYRKVELKEAGFDPARIAEPLHVLLDRERGYEVLTGELFTRIQRGEVRL